MRFQPLRKALERVLVDARRTDALVDVTLVDDRTMRRLNRQYRREDRPTDVLAFPQEEGPAVPGPAAGALLGDVCVAVGVAERQARAHGLGLNAEIARLAVHGTLHLLGYDHATPADERRMTALVAHYVS